MKIAYIIASWGHGRGGHFYSLKTIRDVMPFDSLILNLGGVPSPVFKGDPHVRFFDVSASYISRLREAGQYIREKQVTHLHSFDSDSYLFASILSALCGIPLVNTKPGGPSPRRYYPFVKYLTVFSAEDYEYFDNRRFSGLEKLELIPNRLSPFDYDDEVIEKIRRKVDGRPVLLRIARISHFHHKSISQTLALARELQGSGVGIVPVLVGVIQDEEIYQKLAVEVEGVGGILLTEAKYTMNAKKLLPCADFVVGTGRSFMEAAFARSVLLAPTEDSEFPLLVNQDNYEAFKYSNFSGRGIGGADELVVQDLAAMIVDQSNRDEYLSFVDRITEEDFAVEGGVQKYLDVYDAAICPTGIMVTSINLLLLGVRTFVTRCVRLFFNG